MPLWVPPVPIVPAALEGVNAPTTLAQYPIGPKPRCRDGLQPRLGLLRLCILPLQRGPSSLPIERTDEQTWHKSPICSVLARRLPCSVVKADADYLPRPSDDDCNATGPLGLACFSLRPSVARHKARGSSCHERDTRIASGWEFRPQGGGGGVGAQTRRMKMQSRLP